MAAAAESPRAHVTELALDDPSDSVDVRPRSIAARTRPRPRHVCGHGGFLSSRHHPASSSSRLPAPADYLRPFGRFVRVRSRREPVRALGRSTSAATAAPRSGDGLAATWMVRGLRRVRVAIERPRNIHVCGRGGAATRLRTLHVARPVRPAQASPRRRRRTGSRASAPGTSSSCRATRSARRRRAASRRRCSGTWTSSASSRKRARGVCFC